MDTMECVRVATQLDGLGTMNIASFGRMSIDLTTRVRILILGMFLGMC